MGGHAHVELADVAILGLVWVIVNLMVGWIELISSNNLFRFWIDPVYSMKISSRKRFMKFSGMVPFSIYLRSSAIRKNIEVIFHLPQY